MYNVIYLTHKFKTIAIIVVSDETPNCPTAACVRTTIEEHMDGHSGVLFDGYFTIDQHTLGSALNIINMMTVGEHEFKKVNPEQVALEGW